MALIDIQKCGIGDVVVASWIVHSVNVATGKTDLLLNPRSRIEVARALGIADELLSSDKGSDWSSTPGIGHRYEYRAVRDGRQDSRFALWCESLGYPGVEPVRPTFHEDEKNKRWAAKQWLTINAGERPRILIFPEVEYCVRRWPLAYFMDLGSALQAEGCAVMGMGVERLSVEKIGDMGYWGHSLARVMSLARSADVVVANDSGPAHLAAAVGTRTVVISGPTRGRVVFGHDDNARVLSLKPNKLPCVGCHFSQSRGHRAACEVGGCQALMRLAPGMVLGYLQNLLASQETSVLSN